MAEVNDRLIIELEAKIDKLAAGVAAGNRQIQSFARQAEKDLTDLQLKLEIARARGDKAAAEGLADQIQLAQVKSKLMRQGIADTEAQAAAEVHLAAVIKARHEAEAGGAGVALDKVFDSSKLAVIDAGSAKLRVFGSALEPLGAWGIGAAAGVVALAFAMEQVKRAGEEVGQLQVRGTKLGVNVEDLQALDFVAKESHVSTEQLDQSLEGLSETIGKLRRGVGDRRIAPIAEQMGLGPQQMAQVKDAAAFLPELIEKINALPTLSDKVFAAQRFGIEPLLPMILRGKEGIKELEDEFRSYGLTLSGQVVDDVEKGNLALERAHTIAHDELRNSLIELHPLLVSLGTWWDDMAAHAVSAITVIVKNLPAMLAAGERFGSRGGAAPAAGKPDGSAPTAPGVPTLKQINDQIAGTKALDELQARLLTHTTHRLEAETKIAEIEAKLGHKIDSGLRDQLLGAASKEDAAPGEHKADAAERKAEAAQRKLEEQVKASDDAVFQAQEGLVSATRAALQAQLAASKDGDERAKLEGQIRDLDAEHAKVLLDRKNADLEAQIKLGKIDLLDGIIAEAANTEAYNRQKSADATGAKAASDQRQAQNVAEVEKLTEIGRQGQIDRLQLEASMETVRQKRAALEQQILDLTYQEQKQKLETVINGSPAIYSPDQKKEARAQLDNLNQLQPLKQQQLDKNSAGPLDQYLNSFGKLNDEIEQDGVSAIHDLTNGLVNAALHARNLGQVAEEVFLNLIAKIAEQSIEQEAGPGLVQGFKAVLSVIPAFATGTGNTPSGPILVGEDGPEILNPGAGNTVISNAAIRSATSGRRSGGGALTVIAPMYVDAPGAMTTPEFMAVVTSKANRYADQTARAHAGAALKSVSDNSYISNLNGQG